MLLTSNRLLRAVRSPAGWLVFLFFLFVTRVRARRVLVEVEISPHQVITVVFEMRTFTNAESPKSPNPRPKETNQTRWGFEKQFVTSISDLSSSPFTNDIMNSESIIDNLAFDSLII